ncbi:MAG: cytochrome c [Magnetococcales bacterium]|nr:cytochrome c [Magnetococcales bacterium]MBF0155571.1 cytochrome c [Magnetococcales bacterium]
MRNSAAIRLGLACLLLTAAIPGARAEEPSPGQLLHDKSCLTECHASRAGGKANDLYNRPNRLSSLEKLEAQVATCNQNIVKPKWWPEDEAKVVGYLNDTFYHFKK